MRQSGLRIGLISQRWCLDLAVVRVVKGANMPKLSRRGFIGSAAAAGTVRLLPQIAARTGGRRILTLVYDKSLGMMRAVEKVVFH